MMTNADLIKALRECANWIEAVAASSQYAHDELMALDYGDKLRDAADAIEKLQSDWEYCSDILNIAIRTTGISMTALVKLYEIECADGERRTDGEDNI